MPRPARAASPVDPLAVSPRQRWIAAQRVAAGDVAELAAAMAGIELLAFDALVTCERFGELVRACHEIGELPAAQQAGRLMRLAREAAERALADAVPAVIVGFARLGKLFEQGVQAALKGHGEYAMKLMRTLRVITPEELDGFQHRGRPLPPFFEDDPRFIGYPFVPIREG